MKTLKKKKTMQCPIIKCRREMILLIETGKIEKYECPSCNSVVTIPK